MAQATFHFPRGFLWGTATAAYQVEGNNNNSDWWAWEQDGHINEGHKSGLACDWWGGRWREDFDRAADGYQNAHRMSVEWSRIRPTPDRWDEYALDRYREMVRGLVERGMTPMVTLHHFTDPIWLAEIGGWENETVVAHFEAYVRKVVEALREYVNLWVTINEPNGLAINSRFLGVFPPGKRDLGSVIRVMINLVRGHAAAYRAIHSLQPTARVGMAHHIRGFSPARSWSPLDHLVTNLQSGTFNNFFSQAASQGTAYILGMKQRLPEARNTQDFYGLNYYTRELIAFKPFKPGDLFSRRYFPPGAEVSNSGMLANLPDGLYQAIQGALRFKLPILITENGVDDASDQLRPRYLTQHLHQVWRAVNFNFPIKGYFHWTLVDNFEWERGWTQRFGLWELDPVSQARRKRPSADLYAEICHENGLSSDMVMRYAPQVAPKLFPD